MRQGRGGGVVTPPGEYLRANSAPAELRIDVARIVCRHRFNPLTELFGNRDYKGSTHFFFDVGNGNLLAFFDFPGLDLGPYRETLGNLKWTEDVIDGLEERWRLGHELSQAEKELLVLAGEDLRADFQY